MEADEGNELNERGERVKSMVRLNQGKIELYKHKWCKQATQIAKFIDEFCVHTKEATRFTIHHSPSKRLGRTVRGR